MTDCFYDDELVTNPVPRDTDDIIRELVIRFEGGDAALRAVVETDRKRLVRLAAREGFAPDGARCPVCETPCDECAAEVITDLES